MSWGLNEKNLGLLDEFTKYAFDHRDIIRMVEPDVAEVLHEPQSANRALRTPIDLAPAQLDDKLQMG